jgi:ATP phosphoribosyltransferase|tara:strand:+ start:33138 stop:33839 length:702 start_codon:yes stop_codon:yes gene_type:complete
MLKLGVPSKGRLQNDTFKWFQSRGITLKRTGSDREYTGSIDGVRGIELVLLSAGEIPQELAKGRIHLGVTGTDLIYEKLLLHETQIITVEKMGFGFADLVIAVPNVWIDVNTLHDLDAVAAQFRQTHGFRLRIATKYHNFVRKELREYGVADYQLVDSQGATEGTVANLTAEAIADITSSGATLDANHLKVLSDGVLLRSQASVFASKTANWINLDNTISELCAKMDWKELVL